MSKKLREIRKYKFWECPECTSTYVFYHSKRDVFYCGNCGKFFNVERFLLKRFVKGGEKDEGD